MTEPTPNLGYGVTWPSLDVFTEMARTRRVIPVVRRLLADAETPVGVYRKLAKDAPGTFLLESADMGGCGRATPSWVPPAAPCSQKKTA